MSKRAEKRRMDRAKPETRRDTAEQMIDRYARTRKGRRDPAVRRLVVAVEAAQRVMTDPELLSLVAELQADTAS